MSELFCDADAGLDTNPGTDTAPFKTLAKAAAAVTPGVRLTLRGTFADQRFRPNVSGNAVDLITVVGDPAKPATIVRGVSGGALDLSTGRAFYRFSRITLDNCGPTALAFTNGTHDCGASFMTFVNDSHAAFRNRSPDNFLEDSTLDNVGKRSLNQGNGIDIDAGSNRTRISRVKVGNCGHGGIQIGGDQPSDPPVIGTILEDVEIVNEWATGLILTGQSSGAKITRLKIGRASRSADTTAVFPRPGIECVSSFNTFDDFEIYECFGGGIQIQGYTYATFFSQDSIGNVFKNGVVRDCGYSGWPVDGYGYGLLMKQLNGRQVKDNLFQSVKFLRNEGYKYGPSIRAQVFVDLAQNQDPPGNFLWWPDGTFNGNAFVGCTFLRTESPSSAGETVVLMALPWARTNNTTNPNKWYTLPQAQALFPGWTGNVETVDGPVTPPPPPPPPAPPPPPPPPPVDPLAWWKELGAAVSAVGDVLAKGPTA